MRTRPQATTLFDQIGVLFDDVITQFDGIVLPLGVDQASFRSFNPLDQLVTNNYVLFDSTVTFDNAQTLFNGGGSGRDASRQGSIRGKLY